jgi:hypothetical protein
MPTPKNKSKYLAYLCVLGIFAIAFGMMLGTLFSKEQSSPNIVLESPSPPVVEEVPYLPEETAAEMEPSYIEEAEPEPIEPVAPIEQFTKDGHLATVSEESLDLLIRAANNEEYELIENMLISGVAIQLQGGVRVVDTRCYGAFCSRLTFRFPNNSMVYHTINEAID